MLVTVLENIFYNFIFVSSYHTFSFLMRIDIGGTFQFELELDLNENIPILYLLHTRGQV